MNAFAQALQLKERQHHKKDKNLYFNNLKTTQIILLLASYIKKRPHPVSVPLYPDREHVVLCFLLFCLLHLIYKYGWRSTKNNNKNNLL